MNNKEGSKTQKLNHHLQFSLQESFAFLLALIRQSIQYKEPFKQWVIQEIKPVFAEQKDQFYKKKRIEITEVSQDLLAQLHFFLTYCYAEPSFHDMQPLLAVYRNLNRYFRVRRGLAPMTRADA
jgi:hypothetical protein